MADLIETPADLLPLTIGRCTVAPLSVGPVTSIAPFPGADLTAALAPMGLTFPAPGQIIAKGAVRLVWAGRALAFLLGAPAPDLASLAAVTDQSDGWAFASLSGADAVAVMARLTPLDLRAQAFAPGTAARAPINHLSALILRPSLDRFEIGVFRSMARTLTHEVEAAMRGVAAR